MANLIDPSANDGWNFSPVDDEGLTLREALEEAVRKKRRYPDPDYFQKQIDGVLPPKAIVSPEHYHLSYVYDGMTYPYMRVKYKRSRQAYIELWRLASLSVRYGEPQYWEEPRAAVTIWTPIKGRTGIHQIFIEVVECLDNNCHRHGDILIPHIDPGDGQNYDLEIGPVLKEVES